MNAYRLSFRNADGVNYLDFHDLKTALENAYLMIDIINFSAKIIKIYHHGNLVTSIEKM